MDLAVSAAALLSLVTTVARSDELCFVPGSVSSGCEGIGRPLGWEGFTTGDVSCADWPIDPGTEAGPYCWALPDCPRYEFGWTISASDADPRVTAAAIGGQQTLYLWLLCTSCLRPPSGVSAAVFDLIGTIPVQSFTPVNGFLNAGTDTAVLLAVAGCPRGPIVAAEILVNLPPVSVDPQSWGMLKARYRR